MKKLFKTKRILMTLALGTLMTATGIAAQTVSAAGPAVAQANALISPGVITEDLKLTNEWDKKFKKSDKVNHQKVTFHNRYGITLAADMYVPKNIKAGEKLPAIVVVGPFGAVKEQVSGLYAQTLAERGYIAIAFDPSFTGESGGNVRNVASPEINTQDYSAAIDFLTTQSLVDTDRLGILGICGFGGIALNNASMDTRVKASVITTMYDMTRYYANGYNDANDSAEARHQTLEELNAQRTEDYKNDTFVRTGANVNPDLLPADAPKFIRDYAEYYATDRGYHPRSVNSLGGWNKTSALSFINMPFLQRSDEIQSAVLIIAGEEAHSRYFSEDAFKKLKGDNKELIIVPGAWHTDFYDNPNYIPFDKIDAFYQQYLK